MKLARNEHGSPVYNGETLDELLALDDQRFEILFALEMALLAKKKANGSATLSNEEHVVLQVLDLEREVNNGGYDQYFRNSRCEYAETVVHALEVIGADQAAAITLRAVNVVGLAPVSEMYDELFGPRCDEITDALEPCDNKFYDVVVELTEPVWAFVSANGAAINPGRSFHKD